MSRICILGSHPVFRQAAPFDDHRYEIWACSTHNLPPHFVLPRVNRFYEVHLPALDPREGRSQQYIDELKKLACPVYAMDKDLVVSLPGANFYPKEAVVDAFGRYFIDTSSIAYIMAHAILYCLDNRVEGEPDYMLIAGVGQKSATEYAYQRPGLQYYVQMALDSGVDVIVPEGSEINRVLKYKF